VLKEEKRIAASRGKGYAHPNLHRSTNLYKQAVRIHQSKPSRSCAKFDLISRCLWSNWLSAAISSSFDPDHFRVILDGQVSRDYRRSEGVVSR
jgi:hypothetical protein